MGLEYGIRGKIYLWNNQRALAAIDRFATLADELHVTWQRAEGARLLVEVNDSNYFGHGQIVDLLQSLRALGEFADGGARFVTFGDHGRSVIWVGSPEQVAAAKAERRKSRALKAAERLTSDERCWLLDQVNLLPGSQWKEKPVSN